MGNSDGDVSLGIEAVFFLRIMDLIFLFLHNFLAVC